MIKNEVDILKRYTGIKKVMHVGGCHCHEFKTYKKYKVKSVFIEPIPEMVAQAKRLYKGIDIIQCAATDLDYGSVVLNVTSPNNIGASSIFEFDEHTRLHPEVSVSHTINVPTRTLDSIVHERGFIPNLLVIDTQGSEGMVLAGAKSLLENDELSLIYIEVNFSNVYQGCILWPDLLQILTDAKFEKIDHDHWFEVAHPLNKGQGNALFARRGSLGKFVKERSSAMLLSRAFKRLNF
jgi:FkbM family methyltransferase